MEKCEHEQTNWIKRSKRYETVQETKVDLHHDFVIGVRCLDCGDTMLAPKEIMITYYPYRDEPHYPILNADVETEEKMEKLKPLPEMGIC